MLLILALLLIFGGAGVFVHALWWGLILAVIVGVVHLLTGRSRL